MVEYSIADLRGYVRRNPSFSEYFRFRSGQMKIGSRWVRIREVRSLGYTLEVVGDTGHRLRLPQDLESWDFRKRQIRGLITMVKRTLGNCRVLGGTGELAFRRKNCRFLRLKGRRKDGKLVGIIAVLPGTPRAVTGLLCELALWWDRLSLAGEAVLFVPESWGDYQVELLGRLTLPVSCYSFHPNGSCRLIFPRPRMSSVANPPYVVFPFQFDPPEPLRQLAGKYPELDLTFRSRHWELAYRGLPVLWQSHEEELWFDPFSPRRFRHGDESLWDQRLSQVMTLRDFPPPDPSSSYYRYCTERWLESLVIRNRKLLSPDFGAHLYCQVPTLMEGERRILDILTSTRSGRLAVIELKPTQDIGLLYQGLEYWERVRHHLEQGDFQRAGFFPGEEPMDAAPLLYLVSPLFQFHRVIPVLRSYLRDEVHFECIGVNMDWKKGLKILRRFRM